MKSRIWIILIILLLCNAIGYAVLMADSEAKAAVLSAWEKAVGKPQANLSAAPATAAAAAFSTITVTTRTDEGDYDLVTSGYQGSFANTTKCSLREAILAAETNAAVGGCAAGSSTETDIIQISLLSRANDPLADRDSIQAERELPAITTNLNIVGGNPNAIIIERSHTTALAFRVFTVNNTATVSISGVSISNGLGNILGVGLHNSGNLTLSNVRFFGNNQDLANPTGAGTIYNLGTLGIDNCELSLNYAGNGGAIFNSGTLNITRSSIGTNFATLSPARFGGAIYNSNGNVTVENSAIRGNSAAQGGAIYNTLGTMTFINCSFSENVASSQASTFMVESGIVNLRNVTTGGNGTSNGNAAHDAAIVLGADAELYYRNTIFGDGRVNGAHTITNLYNPGEIGYPISEGHNLSNDSSVLLDSDLGDLPEGTDPLMDTIGTYGTSTENPFQIDTFRLRCGSPAIDAGDSTTAPATDARGVARYDAPDNVPNGSSFPDIGSHEFDYRIVTASTLPNYTMGSPYSVTLTGAGGATPYFWEITSGSLHPDLIFDNATGQISGTPNSGGTYTFTVTLKPNDIGQYDDCAITKEFTLAGNVTCGAFTFSPASLNAATLGTAFNQTVSVTSGGTAPYTFALNTGSGPLPPGLTLGTNGAITGTPTYPGVYAFVVKATDVNACTSTKSYSITVGCGTNTVSVSPTTLPNGTTGVAYNQTVTSNRSPVVWSVSNLTTGLPPGLSLDANSGALTGTPTQSGSFNFRVTATFGTAPNTCTGSRDYTLVINCQTVALSTATFPNAACDTAYTASPTLTASGGTGPYTFALNTGSTLPAGLSLTAQSGTTAKVTGTPTVVVTNHSFTVKATDANGCSTTRAYTISVGCPTITVSPGSTSPAALTAGTLGSAYSQTFTANKTGLSFTVSAGSLPPGLSLATNGALTGTPTQIGTFNFTVTAATGTTPNCTGSRAYSLVIGCPTIALSPSSLPSGTQGTMYSQSLSATPNNLTYSYAVTAGSVPPGLTLSAAGVLSGTPTTATGSPFNFTVTATTGTAPNTCTGSRAYSVAITSNNTAPSITGQTVARQKGSPAGAAITIATVSDGQTAAGSLNVTQISDPAATATGIAVTNIVNTNGTVTALVAASCNATAGTICLQVSDGTLTTKGTFNVTLTENDAPTLTYGTVSPVKQGTAATVNPATGPTDNGTISSIVVQSVTPTVPGGAITVNNSGVVTINNTVAIGQYTVTVRATDNCGATKDASLVVNVVGSILITEFALSGPNGQNDWFVELYNNTNSVQYTTNLNLGFVNNVGSYVTINLNSGLPIQPRSYYLLKGSSSSLDGAIPVDQTAAALPAGFNPAGLAIVRGAVDVAANLIDAVGMTNFASIYVETTGVAWLNNATTEHAWVRKTNTAGLPVDTNNNQADFQLVAPDVALINGVKPLPGAPGPQSGTAPVLNNVGMPVALLKPTVSATTFPNTEIKNETYNAETITFTRSIYLRRTITNNSGAPVTKLRFRIAELSSGGSGIANLRALTSEGVILTVDGQPVTVKGLVLEEPPFQPDGGGVNSTLLEGTIMMYTPLAAGAKVNVQFRLGIISGGSYRFFANVETQN